jgi:magnesium transporter
MLHAYRRDGARLAGIADPAAALAQAAWIDLFCPDAAEVAAVQALGVEVPTLEDMEEIEISSRLYRENGTDYMTVVLPGHTEAGEHIIGPVCFVLAPGRIVTVRHHTPRPFRTYPTRADKVAPGCDSPERIFLSLVEEITGRLADHLEGSGKALDTLARDAYGETRPAGVTDLREALRRVGAEGEMIARVRLSLLTVERALSFFGQTVSDRISGEGLRPVVKGLMRDIQALEVHADFLSARVAQGTDATLGMITLDQNQTIKIVSVVAAVFLPPTLIASVYGMNFDLMPELGWRWGYPLALGLMVASAVGTYLFFKWKKWL